MRNTEWHVRFNTVSTVKDGWRVAEITVSADYEEGNEPTRETFRNKTDEAYGVANAFCQEQNRTRRQADALTAT